jgi:hypothetical protein
MKRLAAVILFLVSVAPAKAKNRPVIQVVGGYSDPSGLVQHLLLVLPDGSHLRNLYLRLGP